MHTQKIVVIGGGFAGLQFARSISSKYEIVLIDRHNYHQFQPLFYQVASARLEPSSISFPLRKVFHHKKNVQVRLGEIKLVDTTQNIVHTYTESFNYDFLIIATGCTTNFFGNEELAKHAMPMKTTPEAMALRNRILLNFEWAQNTNDPIALHRVMNIVIVGGGPTGVELAGAMAEMKRNVLPKDFPGIDFSKMNVYLLEAGEATLGAMSLAAQKKSKEYLERLGVIVMLKTALESYDGTTAKLKDGTVIETNNLIWAAGIKGNLIQGIDNSIVQKGNRILVDRYNKVKGYDNVFALGDIAYMETDQYPKGHPQVANVAINQAKLLAKNLNKSNTKEGWSMFEYKDQGSMATIGKRKAVVDLPFLHFQGRIAWYFWMFLHLMLILSVKNKLSIFINWTMSYFTNDTTLRLILLPSKKQLEISKTLEEDFGIS